MKSQHVAVRYLSVLALMIGFTALYSGCATGDGAPPDEELGVAAEGLSACDTHWKFQSLHAPGSCPEPGAPFCPAQCASTGCDVKYDYVSCVNLPPYGPNFAPQHSFTEYCGCKAPAPKAPTCSDGIQNQAETGIDCGGPCLPCPTCLDGLQNQGETGIDCGGPCPLCVDPSACPDQAPIGSAAACSDGLQCHYGEECCCGECHPSMICSCTQVGWACFFTDACLASPLICPPPAPCAPGWGDCDGDAANGCEANLAISGNSANCGACGVTCLPCAGFAGLSCPDGHKCVDDPSDSCDPANGGADCSGVCIP